MNIKHALAAFGLVVAAIAAIAMTSPTARAATNGAPAVVINDFTCGLFDGDGNIVITDSSHSVITSSGNNIVKCSATGVPNSTGKAVVYSGFECGTFLGTTTNSHETVSASGNATLTCRY